MTRHKLKHLGRSINRLNSNPIEMVLSQEWENQNAGRPGRWSGTLELLLCSAGDGRITRDLLQPEATAAATAIQWLGSPVGFNWLSDTLKTAGYEVVKRGPSDDQR